MITEHNKFSLKDQLFNPKKVEYIAKLIKNNYSDFDDVNFYKDIINKLPLLELKERIFCIRKNLKKYLPKDYKKSVKILLNSLPEPLNPNNTDNDFGDFIFAPFSDFIAVYGNNEKILDFSLDALERITKNFSAEDSIRFFLDEFPKKTLEQVKKWSLSENYHVRRLATEGTRPSLPWSKKINLDHEWVINNILENLFYDKTRYVVRSVANHLNDISKINPNLVIQTLLKWKDSGKQNIKKDLDYLISHSLRTLIKQGDTEALNFLGYSPNPDISLVNIKIDTPEVEIGNKISFYFNILANKNEKLMIDYIIYFVQKNKNSKKLLPKTFKIKKFFLLEGDKIFIEKHHLLINRTTKRLYSGVHKIDIQVNGKIFKVGSFILK